MCQELLQIDRSRSQILFGAYAESTAFWPGFRDFGLVSGKNIDILNIPIEI